MESKRYATAAAFRRALEDRLKDTARREGVDLQRLRRQVAFDRLLARLFQAGQPLALPWVLKGGYAMELRIKSARTTNDIDLTMRSISKSDARKTARRIWLCWRSYKRPLVAAIDPFRANVSVHGFGTCIGRTKIGREERGWHVDSRRHFTKH